MSLTIDVKGSHGRNYVLMVDQILFTVEVSSSYSAHACNIVMRDRAEIIEVWESRKAVQSKIEEAQTQHMAELTCIVEALAELYRENVDVATSEGRALISATDYDAMLLHVAQIHDVAAAALGRSDRLADSHEQLTPNYTAATMQHAVDMSIEKFWVLHRVIRAMHDGECLQCSANGNGSLRSPSELQPPAFDEWRHVAFMCPSCGFQITKDQVSMAFTHWRTVAARNMTAWHEFWGPQESA